MPTLDQLHSLKMNESIDFINGSLIVNILRVPHGWIYTFGTPRIVGASVFVPFVNSVGNE